MTKRRQREVGPRVGERERGKNNNNNKKKVKGGRYLGATRQSVRARREGEETRRARMKARGGRKERGGVKGAQAHPGETRKPRAAPQT